MKAGDGAKVVRLLEAGANANAVTELSSGGFTPLHAAALHGRSEMCTALVNAGADLELLTPKGSTRGFERVQQERRSREAGYRYSADHGGC